MQFFLRFLLLRLLRFLSLCFRQTLVLLKGFLELLVVAQNFVVVLFQRWLRTQVEMTQIEYHFLQDIERNLASENFLKLLGLLKLSNMTQRHILFHLLGRFEADFSQTVVIIEMTLQNLLMPR